MKRYAIGLLAAGLAPLYGQACATALAGHYADSTKTAIDQLFSSAEKLRAGDSAAARSILSGMSSSVDDLKGSADCFKKRAESEHKVCMANVSTLENRIGDLSKQEQESQRRINELDAQIANADKRGELTSREVARLQEELKKTSGRLRERQAKLDELRKWWWVPGYGQYLAVRTLVDEDIQQSNNLQNDIGDQRRQLDSNRATLEGVRRARAQLGDEWNRMRETLQNLRNMRDGSQRQLGSLKASVVYLQDAGVFWGKMRQVLQIDVGNSVRMVQEIQGLLGEKKQTPVFDDPDAAPVLMDLKASLISFAGTVDTGKGFLTMDRTALCGGAGK